MMNITNLALAYRDTTNLVYDLFDRIDNLPKKYKFTLGDKIITTGTSCIEELTLVHKDKKNRGLHIEKFWELFIRLRVLLRVCIEKKLITNEAAAHLSTFITRIVGNMSES